MPCRLALLLVLVAASSLPAADVPWLAEVNTPPAELPALAGPALRPLLVDANGQLIRDRQGWESRRNKLKQLWLDFLGPMPARPDTHDFTVIRTADLPEVSRQLIEYENEPGQRLQAWLLQPVSPLKTGERRPGIVALHPTTPETIDPIAGLTGPEDKQTGLQLARQGFVVLCPKNFLWEQAATLNDAVAQFRQRHPNTLGMHKMLYDAQRATDILAALPAVDPQRLGTVGHSLGAKEVLYLMAFDDRIQAGVASEGGISLPSTNWEAPWYLGPAAKQPDFPRNHHELLALIAPRPFLILGGESGPGAADGNCSWPVLIPAQEVYRLYNPTIRLGLFNHQAGHTIPAIAQQRLTEWLVEGTSEGNVE